MFVWPSEIHPALRPLARRHARRVIAASVDVRPSATLWTAVMPLGIYLGALAAGAQVFFFWDAAAAAAVPALACWVWGTRFAVGVFMRERVVNGRFKRCLYCRYDLRGSDAPACSECGGPATLRAAAQAP